LAAIRFLALWGNGQLNNVFAISRQMGTAYGTVVVTWWVLMNIDSPVKNIDGI